MTDDLQQTRIEAAAEGIWNLYGDRGMFTHAPEHLRNGFMKDARAALAAADAHLPTAEQIAEVLERKLGHAHRDAPYADLTEEAVAVLALLRGEVAV